VDSQQTRHSTYNINYHFLWRPKYRRTVLGEEVADRLEDLVHEKVVELKGEVLDLTVRPDHVHLLASFPPTIAPYQIMHRLKIHTAHVLREVFPWLKSRLPNMWTRNYYVGTAGHVSAATIRRDIEAQKGR
jgi:putative transposase